MNNYKNNKNNKNKLYYNSPSNIIFLDFETTGLQIDTLKVIEVAFNSLFIGDKGYCDLIKINECIPPFITQITNITDDMLNNNGKDEKTVVYNIYNYITNIHNIIGFINPLYFIAHNGERFDFKILINLLNKYDFHINKKWIFMDTIQLSRKLNDYNGHSMAKLCEKYNINNYDAHRAMGDVLTLMDIYVLLSNDICRKNNYNIYTDRCNVINRIIKTLDFPEYLINFLNS